MRLARIALFGLSTGFCANATIGKLYVNAIATAKRVTASVSNGAGFTLAPPHVTSPGY